MSVKGVEMVSIHEDMIDGDTYLKVLEEKVLPLMNPWPGDKSVLFREDGYVLQHKHRTWGYGLRDYSSRPEHPSFRWNSSQSIPKEPSQYRTQIRIEHCRWVFEEGSLAHARCNADDGSLLLLEHRICGAPGCLLMTQLDLCIAHLLQIGLCVKTSGVANGGFGLFATRDSTSASSFPKSSLQPHFEVRS